MGAGRRPNSDLFAWLAISTRVHGNRESGVRAPAALLPGASSRLAAWNRCLSFGCAPLPVGAINRCPRGDSARHPNALLAG
jgi:hypothetical protein